MNLKTFEMFLTQILSHRKIKKLCIAFVFFLLTYNLLNIFYEYLTNYDELIVKLQKNNLKSIQILTYRFDYYYWKLGHGWGQEPFNNCPEKRCYAFKPIYFQKPCEKVDGIMVHGFNLFSMPSRTKYKRNKRQLWLFYNLESQGRTHCSLHYDLSQLDDWFNITATFKTDSDVVADYKEFRSWNDLFTNKKYIDQFENLLLHYKNPVESILDISSKSNYMSIHKLPIKAKYDKASISWIVSHCATQGRREEYVEEIRKYIYVDSYGSCGDRHDPCRKLDNKNLKLECINELLNSYKFYFAFENSLCQDYVSEKFWQFFDSDRIFRVNTVPVVRGGQEDYFKKMAQPHSYINAENFKSAKHLADYLIYLNENETAYLEYFQWKKDYYKQLLTMDRTKNVIVDNWNVSLEYHLREPFCKLCSLLHNETYLSSRTNRVWKLSEWFSKKSNCWDGEEPSYFFLQLIKFFGFCI